MKQIFPILPLICCLQACREASFESVADKNNSDLQSANSGNQGNDYSNGINTIPKGLPKNDETISNPTVNRDDSNEIEVPAESIPVNVDPLQQTDPRSLPEDESYGIKEKAPEIMPPDQDKNPDAPVIVNNADPVNPTTVTSPPQPEYPGDVKGGQVYHRTPNDQDYRALQKCSTGFGLPLPSPEMEVRAIAANISILGSQKLVDNRITPQPEVTLVYASIGILSQQTWDLLNPNGLYCIVVDINILSKLTINLEQRARLSDGVVTINILSSTEGEDPAAVGVNILSNVKVVRTLRDDY